MKLSLRNTLLALGLIVALTLSACAPAATPAPTAAPTQPPATEAPTVIPTDTAVPAPTTPANPDLILATTSPLIQVWLVRRFQRATAHR